MTFANLIRQYVADADQPGSRPLGVSQRYTLKRLAAAPIGAKQTGTVKPLDYLEHCKARRAANVQPQTINQDVTALSSALKYAAEVWEDADAEHALAVLQKAKRQLAKQQLIGKGAPRDRRPTDDEIARLFSHFAITHDPHKKSVIPMRQIAEFQIASGRRISETCRLTWGDVDFEKRICTVRNLKNPKGKGYHGTFPLLGRAWEIVLERHAKRRSNDPTERIFPYKSTSVSAAYTHAKKLLGIDGLRLHDSRREAFSRLFEAGYSVPEVQKVSLHLNPTILLRTYTNIPPESLHLGPASKRTAKED